MKADPSSEMTQTRRFKGWPLLLTTVILAILLLTAPSKVWTILFVGLVAVQGLAYFWVRQLSTHLSLTRERRYHWASVGDRLEERFTLHNRSPLPALWVEIRDQSTLPGYHISQATGVTPDSFTRWKTDGVCTRRGVFRLGPVELRFGDPFGLFEVRQHYPNSIKMVIVPPVVPFTSLSVDTRGELGEEQLRRYSLAESQSIASVRPYHPGDSLSRIHWPTTARRRAFYVRQLDRTSAGNWWLLLDVDATAHHGQGDTATLEKAVLVAASLADEGIGQGQAVGLLTQSETDTWLPPRNTAEQRWQILKTLAELRPLPVPLSEVLLAGRPLLNRNASLIVITANLSLTWLNNLLLLTKQGLVPTVVLIFSPETETEARQAQILLREQGLKTHLIDNQVIRPMDDEAPKAGEWQWKALGLGRAVAIHKPEGQWEEI